MNQIIADTAFSDKLGELASQAIICDPDGRALGFFSPLPERPRVEELQLEPPSSIAETEELRKVRSGKSLDEILARLGIQ